MRKHGGGVLLLSVTQARKLRRKLSQPEALLWRQLQRRPGGFRFRRQRPVGPYIFDFFCISASLAIEVDGPSHDFELQIDHDGRRDAWAKSRGIETLRFAASDVARNMESVLSKIVMTCAGRTPPPRDARSPSPAKAGEDEVL